MTRDPVHIAVIGAGVIGRRHLELVGSCADAVIAGIVDPSAAAAELALGLGVPHHRNLADLVAGSGVDAVIVASPTGLHKAHALESIGLGLPVLIEKPVAATLEDASLMAAASAEAGVPVLVGHHRRHNPLVEAARQVLSSGRIGRLSVMSARFLAGKPDSYFEVSWRRQRGTGGPVLTNLIHDIDTIRYLAGEMVSVQAVVSSAMRKLSVEDAAAVIVTFASGAIGTFVASDATPSPASWELTSGENPDYPRVTSDCYLFAGSEGSLEVPSLRLWSQGADKGWFRPLNSQIIASDQHDPLVRQLEHFIKVARREAVPLVTIADAARSLATVEAILEAAGTGRATAVQVVA